MKNNARNGNTSPGTYSREIDVAYSNSSSGITTLGVVGETLKGPAFEPMMITSWDEYVDYFGGKSPVKFKGSAYPKYELPYIAESYLSESNQLEVCRVLGLSGYNAGPAWIITAHDDSGTGVYGGEGAVVAVIRSRGSYESLRKTGDIDACGTVVYKYDSLEYDVDEIKIAPYVNLNMLLNCGVPSPETSLESFDVNSINLGQFTLVCFKNGVEISRHPVSLNPGTKDYILTVFGNKQDDGDPPIYVEELYDVSHKELILTGKVNRIYNDYTPAVLNPDGSVATPEVLGTVTKYINTPIVPIGEPVLDMVTKDESALKRINVGQRYLANKNALDKEFTYHSWSYSNNTLVDTIAKPMVLGHVYTVRSFVDSKGIVSYYYTEYDDMTYQEVVSTGSDGNGGSTGQIFVIAYDRYFMLNGNGDVSPVACDMNDYKEQYRCASTPWFVSELKGDGKNIEVKKLFRFHTISDGNDANAQVKVSISNVKPDDGTFDVTIRDFYDSDSNLTVLESYTKCSMLPGSSNYIGLKIGTTNGDYVVNSKYVTVEVIENDTTSASVPCGFLGYPMRNYNGLQTNGNNQTGVVQPNLTYNTMYDSDVRDRRQYFGMSNIVGVDVDVLNYKGVEAYNGIVNGGYTRGFHLDSTLNEYNTDVVVTVDGEYGYTWDTTSPNNVTNAGKAPIISIEADMVDTIYANTTLRKFTAYPYGGFDGWDVYRDYRTNTDDFKASRYQGDISSVTGQGVNFSSNINGDGLGLSGNIINSDYYAYLAGVRQFSNPSSISVNLFTTPGIDYVNQRLLVEDIIDMIESERADALYVVTTPDKPFGASDEVYNMYTPDEAVANLKDSGIDSSWVTTYYPWVKYEDKTNNIFVNLPVTKDVVRNMAYTDNNKYPWFAPAGLDRGVVDCVKAHTKTSITDENTLYDGLINPVKSMGTDGVYVMGQKTIYSQDTPLNRVNARRLMIRVRDLVKNAANILVFDQNDDSLANQFLSIVNPILTNVKNNRGISDFRIKVDTSAEAKDRHELPAVIWIKPIGALEYIDLTFVITPQSVSFDDVNI